MTVPELPEVETVANGVHARVAGERIISVWTSGKPHTFKTPDPELAEVLTGARIGRVHRIAKTVVLDLRPAAGTQIPSGNGNQKRNGQGTEKDPAPSAQLLVHLGMTGRLLVAGPEIPWPLHTHAVMTLSGGRELRFIDPRRFGRLSLVRPEPAANHGYLGPGVEPTTVTPADFAALFRGRKVAIKAALLNQSLLHGIGNIYADEGLFRAGIRPRRAAGRLSYGQLDRLHGTLQQVLARAIERGGSSVSDYVDADGVRGFFQQEHMVYGRAGQPCRTCASTLKKLTVGGRTTVYCARCQR